MRFVDFYGDILVEARTMGNEKFNWVAENLPNWLFDELYLKPEIIKSLPNMDQFSTYVGSTIKKSPNSSDLVSNLSLLESFLHRLDQKESANFIRKVLETFPKIKAKILRFGKPEITTPGKRGRKLGSKNKPKSIGLDVDIVKTPKIQKEPQITQPEVQIEPEITQPEVQITPKRAGRQIGRAHV